MSPLTNGSHLALALQAPMNTSLPASAHPGQPILTMLIPPPRGRDTWRTRRAWCGRGRGPACSPCAPPPTDCAPPPTDCGRPGGGRRCPPRTPDHLTNTTVFRSHECPTSAFSHFLQRPPSPAHPALRPHLKSPCPKLLPEGLYQPSRTLQHQDSLTCRHGG